MSSIAILLFHIHFSIDSLSFFLSPFKYYFFTSSTPKKKKCYNSMATIKSTTPKFSAFNNTQISSKKKQTNKQHHPNLETRILSSDNIQINIMQILTPDCITQQCPKSTTPKSTNLKNPTSGKDLCNLLPKKKARGKLRQFGKT